jgi:hypothetical protein
MDCGLASYNGVLSCGWLPPARRFLNLHAHSRVESSEVKGATLNNTLEYGNIYNDHCDMPAEVLHNFIFIC